MTEKYELRLCSNGVYYLYENRLINPDISFDKFNRESAKELVSILNKQNKRIKELEEENVELKDKVKEVLQKELINADTEPVSDEILRTFLRERAVVVRIANELKVDLNE